MPSWVRALQLHNIQVEAGSGVRTQMSVYTLYICAFKLFSPVYVELVFQTIKVRARGAFPAKICVS